MLAKLMQTEQKDIKTMRAEVILTADQEKKLAVIRDRQHLTCEDQELVQSLFNEALTANYLVFNYMKKKDGQDHEQKDH